MKGATMRSALATAVCVLAFVAGCASEPAAPTDPKLVQRAAYYSGLADGCEREAERLREAADGLEVKAKEKDLKAQQYRKMARDAAAGKVVVEPDTPERH